MSSWHRILVALTSLLLGLAAFATPAQARWLRAESPRFVVYSDGDGAVLRAYITRLEAFDATLRFIHGLPLSEVPPSKLDVYLLRDSAELQQVNPRMGNMVAGFYSASDEDIFAVAIREHGDDSTEQHEYTHHFTGNVRLPGVAAFFYNPFADFNNDAGRALLRNWDSPAVRVLWAIDPLLGQRQRAIGQYGRQWFAGGAR